MLDHGDQDSDYMGSLDIEEKLLARARRRILVMDSAITSDGCCNH